jgi:hypothetical protein
MFASNFSKEMGPGPHSTSTLGQTPSLHPSTYPLVTPKKKKKTKKHFRPTQSIQMYKMLCNSTPKKVQHVFELWNPPKERKKKKNPKKP